MLREWSFIADESGARPDLKYNQPQNCLQWNVIGYRMTGQ